jgi:hypothetical protein
MMRIEERQNHFWGWMQLQLDGYLVVGVESEYQIFTKILFYVDKVSPMHPLILG